MVLRLCLGRVRCFGDRDVSGEVGLYVGVPNKLLIYTVRFLRLRAITTTTAIREDTKPLWYSRMPAPFYTLLGSCIAMEERYLEPPVQACRVGDSV
jgi:hypothetical protein